MIVGLSVVVADVLALAAGRIIVSAVAKFIQPLAPSVVKALPVRDDDTKRKRLQVDSAKADSYVSGHAMPPAFVKREDAASKDCPT